MLPPQQLLDNTSSSHMQHVKATLSRPGCARAAVKYYSGLRCLESLQVLFSRCKAPALQVATLLDGCMGVGVSRLHAHMLPSFKF
jgi:hypothetical protein